MQTTKTVQLRHDSFQRNFTYRGNGTNLLQAKRTVAWGDLVNRRWKSRSLRWFMMLMTNGGSVIVLSIRRVKSQLWKVLWVPETIWNRIEKFEWHLKMPVSKGPALPEMPLTAIMAAVSALMRVEAKAIAGSDTFTSLSCPTQSFSIHQSSVSLRSFTIFCDLLASYIAHLLGAM